MDYTYRQNVKMAEDDHLPDNTKCIDLAEDIEAAQCVIMANVVISSEAGPDLRSFLKYKSCNSSHCKNCIYFYHLNLAWPSLVLVPLLSLSGFILAGTCLISFWLALV